MEQSSADSPHSVVTVDGRIHLQSESDSVPPGDLLLAESPMISVPPPNGPIAELGLDASLSRHTLAAVVQYYTTVGRWIDPSQAAQRVTALFRTMPQASSPLAAAVSVACETFRRSGLLPSATETADVVQIYFMFALHGYITADGSLCLFAVGSKIRHSCNPNARMLQNGEIRALRPISNGDEITVSALDDDSLLLPTVIRRRLLQSMWMFHCACEVCAAPTECSSAFKCSVSSSKYHNVCKGIVVPPGVDQDSPSESLVCSLCGTHKQLSEIAAAEEALMECVPCLRSVGTTPLASLVQQVSYTQLNNMLNSNSSEAAPLHPTHWVISVLHLMCATLCLEGPHPQQAAAATHLRVRMEALQRFGDSVMHAQCCLWEQLGDLDSACARQESALESYEWSWKLCNVLFGQKQEQTKSVRRKVKKLRGMQTAKQEVVAAEEDRVGNAQWAEGSPKTSGYAMYDILDGERSPGGTLQFATRCLFDSDDEALLLLDDSDDEW